MKALKRLILGFLFIMISFGVFFILVQLFDVEKTADLHTTKPNAKAEAGSEQEADNKDSNIDSSDNYSLNEYTKLPLTDEAKAELITDVDVNKLVNSLMPAMVSVQATVPAIDAFGRVTDATSAGSGIIMDESDDCYYIVTNNHVIESASSINITLQSGNTYDVTLHGTDSVADLSILILKKSDVASDDLDEISIAPLAESATVETGDMVIAIGNALGYGTSVTVGYISATQREIETSTGVKMTLIQTDAAINPGNSGGALININGEVIGINSSKFEDTSVEGMGFAIPVSTAVPILNELQTLEQVSEEEKGYLGIYMTEVTSDLSTELNVPTGIYINEIIEGSAADNSDLLVGDVITAVNGIEIKTAAQLQSRITSYRYGTEIELTVLRRMDGIYQEVSVSVVLMSKDGLDVAD